MLQSLRDHAQREGLHFGHCLGSAGSVAKDARQGRHFSQPTPVLFALELDRESHSITIHPGRVRNERSQPAVPARP